MRTEFTKYEGAGNDFILIDNRDGVFTPEAEAIARLCDRHFGIGADGVMTLARSAEIDCSMRYYNADGSEGEMCGNGARCFAVREIRTGDGWWFLKTGVPHYVEFVDDLAATDVIGRGRIIRRDTARFPQGTNVNFVQVTGDGTIRVRTYERGVENETLACGTGATAAAIVANFALQPRTVRYAVSVPGGELAVRFSHEPGTQTYTDIRLTGPARRVFGGVFDSENF